MRIVCFLSDFMANILRIIYLLTIFRDKVSGSLFCVILGSESLNLFYLHFLSPKKSQKYLFRLFCFQKNPIILFGVFQLPESSKIIYLDFPEPRKSQIYYFSLYCFQIYVVFLFFDFQRS